MDQPQLISVLRFSIQLFLSESVFLIGMPRRRLFSLRVILSLLCYAFAGTGYYKLLYSLPINAVFPFITLWIGLFILSLCVIIICYDISFTELLFIGVGGYATEHIAFAAAKMVQFKTGLNENVLGPWWEYLLFRLLPYLLCSILLYFCVIRKNHERKNAGNTDIRILLLALVILFTAVVLSGLSDYPKIVPAQALYRNIICPLYSMVCAVLVIMLEFYFSRENRLTRERETMEQLLLMSYAQQKSSKEAIDIINVKCHDLKHQMRLLTRIDDEAERHQYIDEMRQAVSIYDATYHTGCEALDYILREKTLLCDEYGISLSCMADGSVLHFMGAPDIYALFGNILDNALESARKEQNPQKRLISFRLNRQGKMIHIHVQNTCPDAPQFLDGLPVTTKADTDHHGYGVRSIRYIVEKYQGELLMRVKENRFLLDILIPESDRF